MTLDITSGNVETFHKTKCKPEYIHVGSDPPGHVLENIPLGVEKMLCTLSCRKVTRFNPPFSHRVENNFGKEFLKLIDECFPPPTHRLRGEINHHTVMVIYSCLQNMGARVKMSNNEKLMTPEQVTQTCRHIQGNPCPFGGKCKSK